MHRNLIALAMAAAFASPVAFAQAAAVGAAANAKVAAPPAVAAPAAPATPAVPAQASTRASDAISTRTAAKESKPAAKVKAPQNMAAEATAAAPGKGNWWKAADADGDGKLSTVEATANAGLSSRFGTIDANKDGFVTNEEYRSFYTSAASQGETHAAANSAVVTRDLWVKLDADADSKISLTEAKANADLTGSFTDMDVNADGFINQDEYRAYAQLHK
jgi:hypothetical protein